MIASQKPKSDSDSTDCSSMDSELAEKKFIPGSHEVGHGVRYCNH